jgi:upstream activation factor subunit UAF30
LATTSAKKVRQQIEEKLECDLTERRKEIDELVMECLEKKQDVKKEGGKKRSKSDDEEESEEQAVRNSHIFI